MRLHLRTGFTLIELLVVTGIVAFLSAAVVLVLNPLELIRQARDSTRLADLSGINTSLQLYQLDVPGGSFGSSSVVYVSIPDSSPTCTNLGLPPLSPPYSYGCAPNSTYRRTDSTGWIPVNLDAITAGAPLSSLPVDPVNTTSSGYYYTYIGGSWELNAVLESQKYQIRLTSDQGDDTSLLEIGPDLTLAPVRPSQVSSSTITVSSVNPSAGLNNGSVAITSISGSGFGGTATVKLTKTGQITITGTGFTVANATTINGGLFNLSGAATGTWNVIVNSNNATGTLTNGFTVNVPVGPPPNVSSTSPSSRGQGATSQPITITGSNFTNPAATIFSGTGITVNSTNFVSSTQLTANVSISSGAATGARNVTVTNSDSQQGTCTGCFTVNAKPVVVTANPASSTQGTSGLNVVVSGSGFVSGAATSFSAGGTTVTTTTFATSTQVTATVTIASSATTGLGDISVTNPDGGTGIGINVFTINAPVVQTLTQRDYRLYQNANSVQPGTALAVENSSSTIAATSSPIRIRMNVTVGGQALATSSHAFKLQFSTATSSGWTDVGASSSAAIWKFYDNSTPANGTFITTALLAASDVKEYYEESNPTWTNQAAIPAGQEGEWDFPLNPAGTANSTTYYFRLVKSGGAVLDGYTNYPSVAVAVPIDTAPPAVSISSPTNGATVSSTITVSATASDNVGVVGVQFKLDGANLGAEDPAAPYSVSWDTTATSDGSHSLAAAARDAAGNSTTSVAIGVTVNNIAPSSGPVAAYGFDESVGTSTIDSSGNGNTGTLTNGPLRVGGKYGSAIKFDAVNDFVNIPDFASMNLQGRSFTISMWFRLEGTNAVGNYRTLINKGSSGDQKIYLLIDPTDTLYRWSGFSSAFVPILNQFYHLAYTFTATSDTFGEEKIYIDGAPVNTRTGATPAWLAGSWTVGAAGGGHPFNGTIDEVRIYNRALTQTEIQTDMNAPINPLLSPTVTSANPSSKPQGTTIQDIIITGTNFTSPATTTFSSAGITVNSAVVDSATQITANITVSGSATTGAGDITVMTAAGSGTCTGCFTVNPKPVITSTTPTSRNEGDSGVTVDVNGSNFVNGATVSFSGTDITVTNTQFINSNDLRVTVNVKESVASGPGARDVTVTNPDGGTTTQNGLLTISYNPNLKGYWKMNEGSGNTTTTDASGNGNTGTLTNSPAWQISGNCKEGNSCLAFNGTNSYVTIPHSSSLDIDAAPFSTSFWIYPTSLVTRKTPFIKTAQWKSFVDSTTIQFRDNVTASGLNATTTLALNQWTHVLFVVDTATSGRVYINGNSVASTWSGTWAPTITATNAATFPDTSSLSGSLDAIRLYNTTLTATQIQEIYNAGN